MHTCEESRQSGILLLVASPHQATLSHFKVVFLKHAFGLQLVEIISIKIVEASSFTTIFPIKSKLVFYFLKMSLFF